MTAVSPGLLLRESRLRHLVTQRELAARAGTKQSAISRIERGQVSPTIETLEMLLRLLGERLELGAEPIDHGHDLTLLRQNLEFAPADRVRNGVEFSNFVLRNRGAGRAR